MIWSLKIALNSLICLSWLLKHDSGFFKVLSFWQIFPKLCFYQFDKLLIVIKFFNSDSVKSVFLYYT